MSLKMVVLILVLFIAGGVFIVTQQMNSNEAEKAKGPMVSATPPADAQFLPEDYVTPDQVIAACRGRDLKGDDTVIAQFVGLWIKGRDWEGEVTKVSVDDGRTTFTVKYVPGRGATATDIFIKGEIPSEDYTIAEGGLLKYSGRIAGIEVSENLMIPSSIRVDGVTVKLFQKRR